MNPEHVNLTESLEHERAVIGAILIDGQSMSDVADWLKPESFANSVCRTVYKAALHLWSERTPIDIVTIKSGLDAVGAEIANIISEMVGMMDSTITSVHIEHYARQVAEADRRRKLVNLAADITRGSFQDPSFDIEKTYRAALDEIQSLVPLDAGPVPIDLLIATEQERILSAWDGTWEEEVIPTGFRKLDEALSGGFRRGELCILGARPGMGKTACALQWMQNHARRQRGDVIFFSAEMSARAVVRRAIAEVSGIPSRNLYWPTHTQDNKDRILRSLDRMMEYPIAIDSTAGITTDQMQSRVVRYQKSRPVDLVVFDFLELAGDSSGRDSEEQRVAAIARSMKQLALACDVPVVLLSQLSRNVEQRKDKVPTLSDLRYSGSIEAAADQVIFLYRHSYYVGLNLEEPDEAREGTCDVILAKQRDGETGTYTVRFDPHTLRFSDYGNNVQRVA